MTPAQLNQLAQQWRRYLTLRELMFAAAVVALAGAAALLWIPLRYSIPCALGAFAIALAIRLARARPWQIDAAHAARHLDRTFPELEESSMLWLRSPAQLTRLERLQVQRADDAARNLAALHGGSFGAPHRKSLRWPLAAAGLACALLTLAIVLKYGRPAAVETPAAGSPSTSDHSTQPPPQTNRTWPQITSAEMLISPPRYTGRPERRVAGFSAEVEEGANVSWSIAIDQPLDALRLQFGQSDPTILRPADGVLRGERVVTETQLYHLTATAADGAVWRPPEIYSLKVLKDQPPQLKIIEPLAPRTEVTSAQPAEPPPKVTLEVIASDDYRVTGAHIIATVAKGTGEAVKFREEKIAFDREAAADAAAGGGRFTKTFDLVALGLEPGDELYFHVEATDNREPASNRTRSETRFIVWKGAEQQVSTPGAGVAGVNLIPQYFRSQRQIIIDTEKLIADQPTLPASEFRDRSNNLGIDQQLLRQRYGQFLGEEAETHEAHSPDDGHDHGAEMPTPPPRTQSDIAAAFGHQHDVQDAATLFDREVKGTMRQALAAMWEAERFLRMAQPAEALGPENRALEILKELQQADRAYVQRVGFEAAPLKIAERRLQGDLSTVPQRKIREQSDAEPKPAELQIRALLKVAPWERDARGLSATEIEAIQLAEPHLSDAAGENPEEFLGALTHLRRLVAGNNLAPNESSQLERALLRLLPAAHSSPVVEPEIAPAMADAYYRGLTPETQRQ